MQTLKAILPLSIIGALAWCLVSQFGEFDLAGMMLSQPEDIHFVEGNITRFEPYFHSQISANPNGDLRRGSPLGYEGVEVTIACENTEGDRLCFHETWRITAIDHFKRGDVIDVYWEKALVAKPKSVIGNSWNLQRALQHTAHLSRQPGTLRDIQTEKIEAALGKQEAYSKHCRKYNFAFNDREPWQRSFVGYENGNRTGFVDYKDYQAQSKKRLAVIRKNIGITPPDTKL